MDGQTAEKRRLRVPYGVARLSQSSYVTEYAPVFQKPRALSGTLIAVFRQPDGLMTPIGRIFDLTRGIPVHIVRLPILSGHIKEQATST